MRGFSFRESASPEAQFPGTPRVGNSAVVLSCVACRLRSTHVATQDKIEFPRSPFLGSPVNKLSVAR
jgi:hypothetical protein